MKNLVLITVIILEVCMTILTYLVLDSKNSALFFHGGSVGSTMKVFGPSFWLVLLFFTTTIVSTFLFRKNLKFLLVSFLVLFTLWFLSGRTIGVQWNGEVTTGWFYLSINKIILTDDDCTKEMMECMTAKKSPVLQLKLTSGLNEEKFFVGFINRSEIEDYFNQTK